MAFSEIQRNSACCSIVSRQLLLRVQAAMMVLLAVTTTANADSAARMIELKDAANTYTGKVIARDREHCFLQDRFGVMHHLSLSQIQSLRVVGPNYRPSSTAEFRDILATEFRTGFEIQSSTHYVVVAKKGRAKAYATMFEEIYRQVEIFYSVRGFQTEAPETTLVAIVFGSQAEFRDYCGKDEMLWSDDLRGYYSLKSNRVALYEDEGLKNSVTATKDGSSGSGKHDRRRTAAEVSGASAELSALMKTVAGETANTIVHEATHQVGFNIGIHSRLGNTPGWVIEGLATVLEAPGLRMRGKSTTEQKINSERLEWFNEEYETRRQPGDIAKMIATEDMFRNQALDAYSSAWALTYFLTENPARARQFVLYLKMLSERDPLNAYPPEDRLKDFQSVFGDISRLEVDFLRSLERL